LRKSGLVVHAPCKNRDTGCREGYILLSSVQIAQKFNHFVARTCSFANETTTGTAKNA